MFTEIKAYPIIADYLKGHVTTTNTWIFRRKGGLGGKLRENIAWRSELCVVMYGEQHLFTVFCLFCLVCVMYNLIKKSIDNDNGGNTLISERRNGILLPVDRTEALTI